MISYKDIIWQHYHMNNFQALRHIVDTLVIYFLLEIDENSLMVNRHWDNSNESLILNILDFTGLAQ